MIRNTTNQKTDIVGCLLLDMFCNTETYTPQRRDCKCTYSDYYDAHVKAVRKLRYTLEYSICRVGTKDQNQQRYANKVCAQTIMHKVATLASTLEHWAVGFPMLVRLG